MRHLKAKMMRLAALGSALALVLSMGITVLAESTATEEAAPEAADATLNDEQKRQIIQEARRTYDAAVDAVLAEMVAAGALTQASADSYHAFQSAERMVENIDTSNWTLDQVYALRLVIGRKSVNETILSGLLSEGALTQADADAIKLAYNGDRVTLAVLMSRTDTSKTTLSMITRLSDARKAYIQTLADAGILAIRGQGRNMPGWGFKGKDMPEGMTTDPKSGPGSRDAYGRRGGGR